MEKSRAGSLTLPERRGLRVKNPNYSLNNSGDFKDASSINLE